MKIILLTLVCLYLPICTLGSTYAATKKSKLSPTLKRKIRKDNSSYNQCRKKALKKYKKSKRTKKDNSRLSEAMQVCTARFPTAAIYRDCKAEALQVFKKSKKAGKKRLKKCRKIQKVLFYRSDVNIPFYVYKDKIIYAGADLQSSVKESLAESLPNFDCSRVLETFEGFMKPEYLLFGNSPKLFGDLGFLKSKELQKLFKGKQIAPKDKSEDYLNVKGFGRLYGDKKNRLAFFPSVHCYFAADLGKKFDDHKIYYLLDKKKKSIYPYFGVSFYKKGQKNLKTADVIDKLLYRLGKKYKSRKLADDYFLISIKEVREFDSEQDPKNLCSTPRSNKIIVALRTFDKKGLQPKSLVVANIDNACKFGDELARRLKVK